MPSYEAREKLELDEEEKIKVQEFHDANFQSRTDEAVGYSFGNDKLKQNLFFCEGIKFFIYNVFKTFFSKIIITLKKVKILRFPMIGKHLL